MISKLEIYGIALLVAALAVAAAYFYGRHDGTTIERAKWESKSLEAAQQNMNDLKKAIDTSNGISQKTLDAVSSIKVVNRTINNEVRREIDTNTIYANDCLPASGIVLWNAANRGLVPSSPTGSKPAAIVPPRKWRSRSSTVRAARSSRTTPRAPARISSAAKSTKD